MCILYANEAILMGRVADIKRPREAMWTAWLVQIWSVNISRVWVACHYVSGLMYLDALHIFALVHSYHVRRIAGSDAENPDDPLHHRAKAFCSCNKLIQIATQLLGILMMRMHKTLADYLRHDRMTKADQTNSFKNINIAKTWQRIMSWAPSALLTSLANPSLSQIAIQAQLSFTSEKR